jgi:hypothetical protein
MQSFNRVNLNACVQTSLLFFLIRLFLFFWTLPTRYLDVVKL